MRVLVFFFVFFCSNANAAIFSGEAKVLQVKDRTLTLELTAPPADIEAGDRIELQIQTDSSIQAPGIQADEPESEQKENFILDDRAFYTA